MGINRVPIGLEEKDDLIKMSNKHIMISSIADEIVNFQEGLSLFGVLDALKSFPDDALKYLVSMELTAEDISGDICSELLCQIIFKVDVQRNSDVQF